MSLVHRIKLAIQRFEHLLPSLFGNPPHGFSLALAESPVTAVPERRTFNVSDLIGDGFLWAVPKHRRTVEKRLMRKFGSPNQYWKLLRVKTHLRVCSNCGHDYEVGVLCPNCYQKVKEETTEMQQKIKEKLGSGPVEQEVVVLYNSEQGENPEEYWKGKRVVEMEKPRPKWFSSNLTQKSTTPLASTTKDVKPDELG